MCKENDLKQVCSVSKLVEKLGLSRARFYQLQKKGVFPQPIYCIDTRRPLYSLQLQQECLAIRKAGIGHDGKPIIFYGRRKQKSQSSCNTEYKPMIEALKQMGLKVTPAQVKEAVMALYPDGLDKQADNGRAIRDVYRFLSRKA